MIFLCWYSTINCIYCLCVCYCICCLCIPNWNVNIYFAITHYHFRNIVTWTACLYSDIFQVLRNIWYIYPISMAVFSHDSQTIAAFFTSSLMNGVHMIQRVYLLMHILYALATSLPVESNRTDGSIMMRWNTPLLCIYIYIYIYTRAIRIIKVKDMWYNSYTVNGV